MPETRRLAYDLVLIVLICILPFCTAEGAQRSMKYTSRSIDQSIVWQKELRNKLFKILKLDDLVSKKNPISLKPKLLTSQGKNNYTLQEVEISSTPGRRMSVILTLPLNSSSPCPAVVCIHGHGGNKYSVYDPESIYRGFALELAKKGYATIAADVGQHEVYEENRILMGERLWDLIRCIDYLESLPQIDSTRIGCGGLSLGGEMAMWLGAMDERISASVSAGFLTRMDQMEVNHCLCWKFPGLRELVDYADIYSLTAPRPLLCQNGLREPPTQFPVSLAREVLKEIKVIYSDMHIPENVSLLAHEGAHEIELSSLLAFFDKHIGLGQIKTQP